jgi:hypothetical protein
VQKIAPKKYITKRLISRPPILNYFSFVVRERYPFILFLSAAGRERGARVSRYPPVAGGTAQIRAGVGHQHQVLAAARRPQPLGQRRGRSAAHQEITTPLQPYPI